MCCQDAPRTFPAELPPPDLVSLTLPAKRTAAARLRSTDR